MTALKLPHSRVLAELADGLPQHVSHLARIAGVKPHQLNGFWQQMPAHIRGLLRQHDGQWRLVRPLAVFDEEALQRLGAERGFQTTLKHECTSSNDEILNLARTSPEQAHKSLCVAHLQTKGRGRQGRKWTHRLGECLMFSFGWVFDKPQHELGSLAPAVALACRRALAASGLDIQIKWPNDLVAGRDKLGGILIETVRNEGKTAAVIGIGINFVLPKEVEHAASVQALFHNMQLARGAASVHCIAASTLLDKLLGELDAVLTQYAQNGFAPFLEEYQTAHRDHDKPVLLLRDGQTVNEGTVLNVDAQGALHLMTSAGEQTVVSGEISLRPDDTPRAAAPRPPERLLLLDGGNSQLKWAWVENGVFNEVTRAPYRDLSRLGEEWAARSDDRTRIVGCAVCGDLKKALVGTVFGGVAVVVADAERLRRRQLRHRSNHRRTHRRQPLPRRHHHARLPPHERSPRRQNRQPRPPSRKSVPLPHHHAQRHHQRHDGCRLRSRHHDARAAATKNGRRQTC